MTKARKVRKFMAWAVYMKLKGGNPPAFYSAHPTKFNAESEIYDQLRTDFIIKQVEIRPLKRKP